MKNPVSTKVVGTGSSAIRSSTAAISERIREVTVLASTGSPTSEPEFERRAQDVLDRRARLDVEGGTGLAAHAREVELIGRRGGNEQVGLEPVDLVDSEATVGGDDLDGGRRSLSSPLALRHARWYADEAVAGAEGDDEFRRARVERDDPLRAAT